MIDLQPAVNQCPRRIPWGVYGSPASIMSFREKTGRLVEFSRVPGLSEHHEYVELNKLGRWLHTGKGCDWSDRLFLIRALNLCACVDPLCRPERVLCALQARDVSGAMAGYCLRARAEYAYQTCADAQYLCSHAMAMRRYENGADPERDDAYEVHHLLPRCGFEAHSGDLWNLVKLPAAVHRVLHQAYDKIARGAAAGDAVLECWLQGTGSQALDDCGIPLLMHRRDWWDVCRDWGLHRMVDISTLDAGICARDGVGYIVAPHDTQFMQIRHFKWPSAEGRAWWMRQEWATAANLCAHCYSVAIDINTRGYYNTTQEDA